jgi:hypothetical protein
MARRAVRRTRGRAKLEPFANKLVSVGWPGEGEVATASPPANDNRTVEDLPACLQVTDDEVRLLHRYLGRQILGLFS